jgi:hypothetical protein
MAAFGAAMLMAVGVALATAAPSSPSASGTATGSTTVIRLTEGAPAQGSFLDLGPRGLSLGDQFVASDTLFRSGTRIGRIGRACTFVRVSRTTPVTTTSQCVATLSLPRGQIAAQGLATGRDEGDIARSVLAITGGTGIYKTAHGELHRLDVAGQPTRLTLVLVR